MLLRAEDGENKVEGDYVVDTSETYFYLSVVNSNMKYETIKLIGKDIYKTKTNKHTIKVEASGFLNPETSLSWNDQGDTFRISGKSGSYTVNKKTCTVN